MKQSLQLKTAQRLALTPQLKTSLHLLQLPSIELSQAVAQELVNNPLLEEIAPPAAKKEQEVEPTNSQTEDVSWPQDYDLRTSVSAPLGENPIEQTLACHESLADHLNWQISLTHLSERDQQIAIHLIHCLDENGYLGLSLEEVCGLLPASLEAQEDEINAVLSLIKTLEPRGAGARDLQERLLILLDGKSSDTPGLGLARAVVADHLDLLAKRDFSALGKQLKVNTSELAQALELVQALNPRIANQFAEHQKEQIQPDVVVNKVGQQWIAKLNSNNQLKLKVNHEYTQLLQQSKDKQSKEFIDQYLPNARTFIKGLHSRYDTLLAVSKVMVNNQQDFFNNGSEQLKPMTLRDVAEQLDLHESTVSRAVSGKYLLCNHGVFQLKYFFSTAVGATEDTSATAIRSLIKKMVAAEPKTKPLSDAKIAQQLEQQGHQVARRTVAKYRESLQIAPSSQRKSLHPV